MADKTTTGLSSRNLRMRSATSLIRSADATNLPPNFMMTVNPTAALSPSRGVILLQNSRPALAPDHQPLPPPTLPSRPGSPTHKIRLPTELGGGADGESGWRLPSDHRVTERHRHLQTRLSTRDPEASRSRERSLLSSLLSLSLCRREKKREERRIEENGEAGAARWGGVWGVMDSARDARAYAAKGREAASLGPGSRGAFRLARLGGAICTRVVWSEPRCRQPNTGKYVCTDVS